jgi:hypothetical protein
MRRTFLAMLPRVIWSAVCAAILLAALGEAQAITTTGYTFTNIVDTNGPITRFFPPSINAAREVAFYGENDAGRRVIQKWTGGSLTTIADTAGEFNFLFVTSSINDSGVVAFVGTLDSGVHGVFTGGHGGVTAVVDVSDGFYNFINPSINEAGTIAFQGRLGIDPNRHGIYTTNGSSITTAVETGGMFSAFWLPEINNVGAVAFIADSNGTQGVFVKSEHRLTRLGGATSLYDSSPRINDAGLTTFLSSGSIAHGIYTGTDSTASLYLGTAGPFASLGMPDVNNTGTFVFNARLDNGRSGLYTGANPQFEKVIENGDALFGSTVNSTESPRLNDRGDVVFEYRLANGVEGIAVAVRVPEPAVWVMMAFVLMAAESARRGGVRRNTDRTPWRTSA